MKTHTLSVNETIAPFVKNILVFEEAAPDGQSILPFYADGLPGLLFHLTPKGQWVQPHNKKMPVAYIYGQTLDPIELHIHGSCTIVLFQLYPFVLKSFFNLEPHMLNDACYDLLQVPGWKQVQSRLTALGDTVRQASLIEEFLYTRFLAKKGALDMSVREALGIVMDLKGQLSVQEMCERVHLSLRTFQRRFLSEVGITPKEFIQIIRFQHTLEQVSEKDYGQLTDLVYTNGFADQSHFIRVFKSFTGKTPKTFVKK